MKKTSRLTQCFSMLLGILLLLSNGALAYAYEANFWQERRQLKDPQPAQLATAAPFGQSPHWPSVKNPSFSSPSLIEELKNKAPEKQLNFSLLSKIGSVVMPSGVIRDIQLPSRSSETQNQIVIYIQDVHGQKQAQQNIGQMILNLQKTFPDAIVGLEGTSGRIPFESFRGADQIINQEIGSFFLDTGLITGAEYAGFSSIKTPSMFGLEDKDLYLKHVSSVKLALARQDQKLNALDQEQKDLHVEKSRFYSKELKALDGIQNQYRQGQVNIGEYVSYLIKVGPELNSKSTLPLFLDAWNLERQINFDQAERERNQFFTQLSNNLNKNSLDQLLQDSLALKSGSLTYPDYYRRLQTAAHQASINLSRTPTFQRYVKYVLQSDEIRPEIFLSDLRKYEKSVWRTLIKTEKQKEIYEASTRLDLTEKLVQLNMTPGDWAEYKAISLPLDNKEELKEKEDFETFYQLAEARDVALSSKLKEELESTQSDISIVVAGGFHSEGLKKHLEEENITLITVSPKLGEISSAQGNGYLRVFTREKTPLEKLFDSPEISIVKTLATNPISKELNPGSSVIARLSRKLGPLIQEAQTQGSATVQENAYMIGAAKENVSLPSLPGNVVLKGITQSGLQIAVHSSERKEQVFFTAPAVISFLVTFHFIGEGLGFSSALAMGLVAGVVDLVGFLPFFLLIHKKVIQAHPEYFENHDGSVNIKSILDYLGYLTGRHFIFGAVTLIPSFYLFALGLGVMDHVGFLTLEEPSLMASFLSSAFSAPLLVIGHKLGIEVHKLNNEFENFRWRGVLSASSDTNDDSRNQILIISLLGFAKGALKNGDLAEAITKIAAIKAILNKEHPFFVKHMKGLTENEIEKYFEEAVEIETEIKEKVKKVLEKENDFEAARANGNPLFQQMNGAEFLDLATDLELIHPKTASVTLNDAIRGSLVSALTEYQDMDENDVKKLSFWGVDIKNIPLLKNETLMENPKTIRLLTELAGSEIASPVFSHLLKNDVVRYPSDLDLSRRWSIVAEISRKYQFILSGQDPRKSMPIFIARFTDKIEQVEPGIERSLFVMRHYGIRGQEPLITNQILNDISFILKKFTDSENPQMRKIILNAMDEFLNNVGHEEHIKSFLDSIGRYRSLIELKAPDSVINSNLATFIHRLEPYFSRALLFKFFLRNASLPRVQKTEDSIFGKEPLEISHWAEMLFLNGNWSKISFFLSTVFPAIGSQLDQENSSKISQRKLLSNYYPYLGDEDRLRIGRRIIESLNSGSVSEDVVAGFIDQYDDFSQVFPRRVGLLTNPVVFMEMYKNKASEILRKYKMMLNIDQSGSDDDEFFDDDFEMYDAGMEDAFITEYKMRRYPLLSFFSLNPSPENLKSILLFWNSNGKLIENKEVNAFSWVINNIPKGSPTRDARRQLHSYIFALVENRAIYQGARPIAEFMSRVVAHLKTNVRETKVKRENALSFVNFSRIFSGLPIDFQLEVLEKLEAAYKKMGEEAEKEKNFIQASHLDEFRLIIIQFLLEEVLINPVSLGVKEIEEINKSFKENIDVWTEGDLLNRLLQYYSFQKTNEGQEAVERYILILARAKNENNKFNDLPRYDFGDPRLNEWFGENLTQSIQSGFKETIKVSARDFDFKIRYENIFEDLINHMGLDGLSAEARVKKIEQLYQDAKIDGEATEVASILNEIEQSFAKSDLIPLSDIEQWQAGLEQAGASRAFPNWEEVLINFNQFKLVRKPSTSGPVEYDFVITEEPLTFILSGEEPYYTCQRCVEPTGQNTEGRPINRARSGQYFLAQVRYEGAPVMRSILEIAKEGNTGKKVLLVERLYTNGAVPAQDFQERVVSWAKKTGEIDYIVFSGGTKGEANEYEAMIEIELLPDIGPVYRDTNWVGFLRAVDLSKLGDEETDALPKVETWRSGIAHGGHSFPSLGGETTQEGTDELLTEATKRILVHLRIPPQTFLGKGVLGPVIEWAEYILSGWVLYGVLVYSGLDPILIKAFLTAFILGWSSLSFANHHENKTWGEFSFRLVAGFLMAVTAFGPVFVGDLNYQSFFFWVGSILSLVEHSTINLTSKPQSSVDQLIQDLNGPLQRDLIREGFNYEQMKKAIHAITGQSVQTQTGEIKLIEIKDVEVVQEVIPDAVRWALEESNQKRQVVLSSYGNDAVMMEAVRNVLSGLGLSLESLSGRVAFVPHDPSLEYSLENVLWQAYLPKYGLDAFQASLTHMRTTDRWAPLSFSSRIFGLKVGQYRISIYDVTSYLIDLFAGKIERINLLDSWKASLAAMIAA